VLAVALAECSDQSVLITDSPAPKPSLELIDDYKQFFSWRHCQPFAGCDERRRKAKSLGAAGASFMNLFPQGGFRVIGSRLYLYK
jgi:hypothetical protein